MLHDVCTLRAPKPGARIAFVALLAAAILAGLVSLAVAQPPRERRKAPWEIEPTKETQEKVEQLIEKEIPPQVTMYVDPTKSKLIQLKRPVTRFSITNPSILDIVQYSPTEFELIGLQVGVTTMTLWYPGEGDEPEIIRYLVRVAPDETVAIEYGILQDRINELFPCSSIQLIPVADKLVVRGQAKDAIEVSRILAILSQQQTNQAGSFIGPGNFTNLGQATRPYLDETDIQAANLINMLEVPGEQQIMLKVRVAELTRSSVRSMGSDFAITRGEFVLNSLFNGTGPGVSAVLGNEEFNLAMSILTTNSYGKILAEPNLVTLNGRPASFQSGGSFAVPTVVGVAGVGAVSTDFQSFGTQLFFTPQLIEKDRIRLQVTPSFSTVNQSNTVNGIPGLDSRSVTTTVDMREGQWLAIGGLLQDEQSGNKNRFPQLGDIPGLGVLLSSRATNRDETELMFFISPEIIRPLEAEEAPLILPGMEITEPTDWDFFVSGYYEGKPGYHHRSTVWPIQRFRIWQARKEARQEARRLVKYQQSEAFYVYGDCGFSD